MSTRKYTTRTVRMQTTDPKTGEVTNYLDKSEVIAAKTEPFFFTYSKEIMALYGKSVFNATTKVLWKLLELADYNTGKVAMNIDRRRDIMEECSISRPSFDRAIRELIDVGIIAKDGVVTYKIDENMFWKGDRKTREKLIKDAQLKISFTPVFSEDTEDMYKNLVEIREGAN